MVVVVKEILEFVVERFWLKWRVVVVKDCCPIGGGGCGSDNCSY